MSLTRNFKIGEHILANGDIPDLTGGVYLADGDTACIMVYDPSKGETPYGLRRQDEHINSVYVGEAQLRKDPSRAHLTPKG